MQQNLFGLAEEADNICAQLNPDQLAIFNAATLAVQNDTPAALFVDGPGGTDKIFLYSVLLARVHADGHIALAVTFSSIADLLLSGGTHCSLQIQDFYPTA